MWAYYYFGAGQPYLIHDQVAELKIKGDDLAAAGDWEESLKIYDEALSALEKMDLDKAKASLHLAKSRVYLNHQQIVQATKELESLMAMIHNKEMTLTTNDQEKVRAALAHSLYYTAWHMRLEGVAKQFWKKDLESARQNFRFLAESKRDNQSWKYNQ